MTTQNSVNIGITLGDSSDVYTNPADSATIANAAVTTVDATASRALDTTYTNSNAARSILVMATIRCVATLGAGNAYVQAKADTSAPPTTVVSGLVGIQSGLLNEDNTYQICFVVPAGTNQNYRIDSSVTNGTTTLHKWFEYTL